MVATISLVNGYGRVLKKVLLILVSLKFTCTHLLIFLMFSHLLVISWMNQIEIFVCFASSIQLRMFGKLKKYILIKLKICRDNLFANCLDRIWWITSLYFLIKKLPSVIECKSKEPVDSRIEDTSHTPNLLKTSEFAIGFLRQYYWMIITTKTVQKLTVKFRNSICTIMF